MALRMVGLNPRKSGGYIARKAIPHDVREAYAKLYGLRREERFTLSGEFSQAVAKAKHSEWLAEIETRIEKLRAHQNGRGQPLTQKQAQALAGQWYRWFISQHEDNPGSAKQWRAVIDHLLWNVIRPEAPDEYESNPEADTHWEWAKEPEVREAVRPRIAELARVASFLAAEGVSLLPEAHALFVDAVSDNLYLALEVLARRAIGDHSPDETPLSFPAYTGRSQADDGMDPLQLWEAFVSSVDLAPTTVSRWRAVFVKLKDDFPGTSIGALTPDQAGAWITGLVNDTRKADTVSSVWIPAARRVFGWAERNKRIAVNPFTEARVEKSKRVARREGQWFTDDEIAVILVACSRYTQPKTATQRARRWVMWLCAYSGARAGEITQLRGRDITQHGDISVMHLTPEAGTMKTRQARRVPLHKHLIEQGFLEFVKRQGDGPLFYDPPKKPKAHNKLKPSRTPPQTTRAHLGEWVRELGVTDPEVSPTHGWRHTFQRVADRAGIREKVSDAIVGHVPATVGRRYAKPGVEDMAEALKKFPRYRVDFAT
jgi:integrase